MPISKQEGAGEYISIKQIWLKQIDRCNDALSNYALKGHQEDEGGLRAAISSVEVLIINLVDYGDAPLKTEYVKWWNSHRNDIKDNYPMAISKMKLGKIIEILNKYQMLHDSLPRGYSNVTLEGVKEM